MIFGFLVRYWKYLALVLVVTGAFFFVKSMIKERDDGIRADATQICNAEWEKKSRESELKLKQEVEDVRAKRKIIQNNARPAGKLALVQLLESGAFSKP